MKSTNSTTIIRGFCTLCIFTLMSYSSITRAEEIRIPVGSQGDASIEVPVRGSSQLDVEQTYGQPDRWTDKVGKPEISVWHYSEFSVYFESDLVIHTVVRHKQPERAQIAFN